MLTKAATFVALLAVAHARFGQEQIPIPAIAAVQGGSPGVAQTIAGAAVSDLLAATNACDKLKRGDQIIAELGTGADAIAAAIGIVASEKNFNPFVQSIPTICSDPTLPASEQLRGITPKIDPAVGGSDVANALSASSSTTPLDATGKSVADLLSENGFTNFTSQAADGTTAAISAGGAAGAGAAASDTGASSNATTVAAASASSAAPVACGAAPTVDGASSASSNATADAASSTSSSATATTAVAAAAQSTTAAAVVNATGGAAASSSAAGVDFGLCTPTMKFEGGLGGRPATEFTFQAIDPLVAKGQEEALNPNIITNRICDQLTNVCNSNAAAKTLCLSAKAQILALGTRDKTTADAWNSALGFAGVSTARDLIVPYDL